MVNGNVVVPPPINDPVRSYAPGTPERADLKAALARMSGEKVEIPLRIGGERIRTGKTHPVKMPHRHAHVLAEVSEASEAEVRRAIDGLMAARREWARTPFHDRAAIFLKAADLLAGPWRQTLNAATMLGQSKTAHQAEIDAACELVDFFRFNAHFAARLMSEQPISPAQTWNQLDLRPLDGFVFAVTPFNFTSIAGNLPTAPALMANVVLFKPATTAALAAHVIMDLLHAAGLPDGVISMVQGDASMISRVALEHPDLGGVHFTGSTHVFQGMWKTVGENIARYKQYPRLVGETGGKDFILAHPSADLESLAVAIVRGSFEYQGQKCSACSRVYVPESLWPKLEERISSLIADIRMGDVADFRNFMGAVIDEKAFRKMGSYLELARQGPDAKIVAGGEQDGREGWFVKPTLVRVTNPRHRLMTEEIFGPIVTAYVYPDGKWMETLHEVDGATPYALTGAVFARDRGAVHQAREELRFAAGNFYVNDKPTGAVVGQQPFGGSRASGTNDKAGSIFNLLRWTSPRALKENFAPPTTVPYPFMGAE